MKSATAVAAAPGIHTMDITVYRSPEGETWFRAAVLRLVGGRMRLTLDGRPSLTDVFRDDVGKRLQELCNSLDGDQTVASFPDMVFSVGAAVSQGLTMMVTAWKDGIQQITIAMRKILGDPFSLFHRDAVVFGAADTVSESLQETAVQKLIAPLSDLTEAFSHSLKGQDPTFAAQKTLEIRRLLDAQSHMLRSLLSQIVDETSRGILGPPEDEFARAAEYEEIDQ